MGGMTVTEVDAGNIIVPPRQRKVNPVKEKIPRTGSWLGSSPTEVTPYPELGCRHDIRARII